MFLPLSRKKPEIRLVSGANRSSCCSYKRTFRGNSPLIGIEQRYGVFHRTLRSFLSSPGLKSDILHGKTDRFGRNLPLQRISCSLQTLDKGAFHPYFHACLMSILCFLQKIKSFFVIFSEFFCLFSIPQNIGIFRKKHHKLCVVDCKKSDDVCGS